MAELKRGMKSQTSLRKSGSLHSVRSSRDESERPLESDFDPEEVGRKYTAFGGKTYAGPVMQTVDVKTLNPMMSANSPHYLGPDGVLYDVHYNVATVPDDCDEPGCFNPYDPVLHEFPSVDDFEFYSDFEQALLDWFHDVSILTESIHLPRVVGRTYARPKVLSGKEGDVATITTTAEVSADIVKDSESGSRSANASEVGDDEDEEEMEERLKEVELAEKMDHDVWDCYLCPSEPLPADFDSEQEYEVAMLKWAAMCTQMERVPPHPRQFEKLLNIKQRAPEHEVDEDKEALEADSLQAKLAALRTNLWKDWAGNVRNFGGSENLGQATDIIALLDPRMVALEKEDRIMNQLDVMRATEYTFRYYPKATMKKLQEIFTKWVSLLDHRNARYGSFNPPLLPIIHGVFVKDNNGPKSSSTVLADPLRRTDLTDEMAPMCHDAPRIVGNKRIEFKTPQFFLGRIDLEKILAEIGRWGFPSCFQPESSKILSEALNVAMVRLDHSLKFDILNQWHNPTYPPEKIDSNKANAALVFNQEPITVEHVREVIFSPIFLDMFQNLLCEPQGGSDDEQQITVISRVVKYLTEENFEEILNMYWETSDESIHAKHALFINEALQQSPCAPSILKRFISNQNTHSMHTLALVMTHFTEVPVDVFPDCPDMQKLVCCMFGDSVDAIVHQLMLLYFLNIVAETIKKQGFAYVSINSLVAEARNTLLANLGTIIRSDRFFINHLFLGIAHRSSNLSAFFLFLVVQLMGNAQQNKDLKEHLQSDRVDLIKKIRDLSYSKFTHVQYACRRLFAIAQTPEWWMWSISKYQDLVFEDLTTLPRPLPNNAPMPLLITLALEFCVNIIRSVIADPVANKVQIVFMIEQQMFTKALAKLTAQKGKADQTSLALAVFMKEFSRAVWMLKCVTGVTTDAHKRGPASSEAKAKTGEMEVRYQDIRNITSVLQELPNDSYEIKTGLICALRHLLKVPSVFDLIKKEALFFSTIQTFCKDGNDVSFNREAWRLFYQSIRYHPNVVEWLNKCNLLTVFVESTSLGSGMSNVLASGLHYIAKLFLMWNEEQARVAAGYDPVREDIKTMEKDIRLLSQYMIKHLIKIHMIFMRFTENTATAEKDGTPTTAAAATAAAAASGQTLYPGLAFRSLVELYNSLVQSPHVSKLLKEVKKKPEYRSDLQKVQRMTSGSDEVDVATPPSSPIIGKNVTPLQRSGTQRTRIGSVSVTSSWKK